MSWTESNTWWWLEAPRCTLLPYQNHAEESLVLVGATLVRTSELVSRHKLQEASRTRVGDNPESGRVENRLALGVCGHVQRDIGFFEISVIQDVKGFDSQPTPG